MRTRHLMPLVGFGAPTVIIGYGFVIPRSRIAGVNELTRHVVERLLHGAGFKNGRTILPRPGFAPARCEAVD